MSRMDAITYSHGADDKNCLALRNGVSQIEEFTHANVNDSVTLWKKIQSSSPFTAFYIGCSVEEYNSSCNSLYKLFFRVNSNARKPQICSFAFVKTSEATYFLYREPTRKHSSLKNMLDRIKILLQHIPGINTLKLNDVEETASTSSSSSSSTYTKLPFTLNVTNAPRLLDLPCIQRDCLTQSSAKERLIQALAVKEQTAHKQEEDEDGDTQQQLLSDDGQTKMMAIAFVDDACKSADTDCFKLLLLQRPQQDNDIPFDVMEDSANYFASWVENVRTFTDYYESIRVIDSSQFEITLKTNIQQYLDSQSIKCLGEELKLTHVDLQSSEKLNDAIRVVHNLREKEIIELLSEQFGADQRYMYRYFTVRAQHPRYFFVYYTSYENNHPCITRLRLVKYIDQMWKYKIDQNITIERRRRGDQVQYLSRESPTKLSKDGHQYPTGAIGQINPQLQPIRIASFVDQLHKFRAKADALN